MKRWAVILLTVLIPVIALKTGEVRGITLGWFDATTSPEVGLLKSGSTAREVSDFREGCEYITFKKLITDSTGKQVITSVTECAQSEGYGVATTNYLKLTGTDVAYRLNGYNSSIEQLMPVPDSNDFITYRSAGGTAEKSNIYHYKNIIESIEAVYSPLTGKPLYYKAGAPSTVINYSDNTKVDVYVSSVNMIGDRYISANTTLHQVVIDLDTKLVRRVGRSVKPTNGTKPDASTAITADGEILFLTNHQNNRYYLFDLTNCSGVNDIGVEQCVTRELTDYIKQQIPNILEITYGRFANRSVLEFYAKIQKPEGGWQYNKYKLSLPGASTTNIEYLALGDSFASGEGAYNYKLSTDLDTNKCHISLDSYPYLISNELGFGQRESVACSGAQIKDVFQTSRKLPYSEDRPQASGKDESTYDVEIFDGFLPGYRRQHEFVEEKKPAVVTLSIGGNDINFGKKLQYCILTPYSCYNNQEARQKILKEIKGQFQKLTTTYQELRKSNPFTRIYVIGYPKIVMPGGNCANNVRLSGEELQLAEDIESDLNTMIKRATERAGVFYVDTSNAFMGTRLCEAESWKLAVNGITAGNDKFLPFNLGPLGNETYHPNKLGHIKYKQAILTATNNLTTAMPEPNEAVAIHDMPSVLVPDMVDDSSVSTPILTDSISDDYIVPGFDISQDVTDLPYFLKPGSTFRVEVHSTPIEVGTAVATGMRSLSIDASLPEDLEPGSHSLHIIGTNINNEPIDIYKDIVVIKSQEDFDGDGVLNENDTCQFIQPLNIDTDKDGVDDSCDPEIAEPPVVVPPPEPVEPTNPNPIPNTPLKILKSAIAKFVSTLLALLRFIFQVRHF